MNAVGQAILSPAVFVTKPSRDQAALAPRERLK
jgi:hypothetical protein